MTDLSGTIVIAGGLIATKELSEKLLGPTCEYLGEYGRDLVRRSVENIGRIFEVASKKVDIEKDGTVNPRVMNGVVGEGRFIEDVFAAEYFGGVLASARTPEGNDDSAIPFVTLLKGMSADQIRLHFIIYSLVSQCPERVKCPEESIWEELQLRIAGSELMDAMQLSGVHAENRVLSALSDLAGHQLIQSAYGMRFGSLRMGTARGDGPDVISVKPTKQGSRLFLRALGLRGLVPEVILTVSPGASLTDVVKGITLPADVVWKRHKVATDTYADVIEQLQDEISTLKDELEEVTDKVDEIDLAIEKPAASETAE